MSFYLPFFIKNYKLFQLNKKIFQLNKKIIFNEKQEELIYKKIDFYNIFLKNIHVITDDKYFLNKININTNEIKSKYNKSAVNIGNIGL